jgi:hypothetical protein
MKCKTAALHRKRGTRVLLQNAEMGESNLQRFKENRALYKNTIPGWKLLLCCHELWEILRGFLGEIHLGGAKYLQFSPVLIP